MQRNFITSFRTLAAAAVAVVAIACSDQGTPTEALGLRDRQGAGDDSAQCDYALSGTIFRYTGGGTAGDTLGGTAPVAGARVRVYFVGPIPGDSVPNDTTPNDTIPNDTIPNDSTPNDSTGLRLAGLRFAAHADTSHGGGQSQDPVATVNTGGDGTYVVDGLCNGIYRVEVTLPGSTRSSGWNIVWIKDQDRPQFNFYFPPR